MTAGLLVNPRSGKANRKGLALARQLEGHGIPIRILDRFADLPRHLDALAEAHIDTLYISAGDGTVQAIQTDLAERRPFAQQPRLGLLPHGTTNMTAADLGLRHRSVAAQAAFIAANTIGEAVPRATVRVANPRDGRVRHGMFLGTGALWQAALATQSKVHAAGLKGEFANSTALALALAKALFTRADPADRRRIDRPHPIRVEALGRTMAQGEQLLALATTLDRLILGARPFWGAKTGPLRVSIFPYPVPANPLRLYRLMYGSETRRVVKGAFSFACDRLAIETPCPFVLDGEFFDPPLGETLRVEAGPEFTYIRG